MTYEMNDKQLNEIHAALEIAEDVLESGGSDWNKRLKEKQLDKVLCALEGVERLKRASVTANS